MVNGQFLPARGRRGVVDQTVLAKHLVPDEVAVELGALGEVVRLLDSQHSLEMSAGQKVRPISGAM